MTDQEAIVLRKFSGVDIAAVLVEREADAVFSLSIRLNDGTMVRLAGARSLPDLEALFGATWASLADEGSSQREFGRYLLEFFDEAHHTVHGDEVAIIAVPSP